MNTHKTEVSSRNSAVGTTWVATCACGWTGEERGSTFEAGEDAERHLEPAVLTPIVLREIIRLLEGGNPDTALETARSFLNGLEREPSS